MAQLFLSYDHDDFALAKPLAAALEKAGHSVWYDRHIHGGAQFSQKIEKALDSADAVLVLWSANSLESAWVRDEAAEGRDRGKLVPLSVGAVTPPMGFRQYQTIDLGKWTGRGRVPKIDQILEAVETQAGEAVNASDKSRTKPRADRPPRFATWLPWKLALVVVAILAALGWWWLSRPTLPVVAVAAADPSPRSQAAAGDLFVKLGSLAQVGEGKWQLTDAAAGKGADLVFRTANSGTAEDPRASLVLVDGERDTLLWSREFGVPGMALADLRQQVSMTAGRVLDCALESRAAGGLKADLLKRFLDACAISATTGFDDPTRLISVLRSITQAKPKFAPAWSRLLDAEGLAYDFAAFDGSDRRVREQALRKTIDAARAVSPQMPAVTLAELLLLPEGAYGETIDLLNAAANRTPDDARLQSALSGALLSVGRMREGVQAARLAADLDPLSPALKTNLILTMAYAGRIEEARRELAQFERLWAGTGALREALWAFHLRFGDPEVAKRHAPLEAGTGLPIYLDARRDRSPAKIAALADYIMRARAEPHPDQAYGWAVYALGEFGLVDKAFEWIAATPTEVVAGSSYLFFRAPLAPLRADPRFIGVAKRIGLVDYWRESAKWPDFCSQPGLTYDCKAEVARHGG